MVHGWVPLQDVLELSGCFVELYGSGCVVPVWCWCALLLWWAPGAGLCGLWLLGWCGGTLFRRCAGAARYAPAGCLEDGPAFMQVGCYIRAVAWVDLCQCLVEVVQCLLVRCHAAYVRWRGACL